MTTNITIITTTVIGITTTVIGRGMCIGPYR